MVDIQLDLHTRPPGSHGKRFEREKRADPTLNSMGLITTLVLFLFNFI